MTEHWYFDSHAHYSDPKFLEDQETLLSSMAAHGIGRIMNIGCCEQSSRDSIALAEKYDFMYATVGSHPDSADEVDDRLLDEYRRMAAHPKVVGIGEIGLDYYYETVPRQVQQHAFVRQLELAQELDLPVVVHQRDAVGDTMDIIRKFPKVRGVFHCFSGSVETAKELVRLGWHLGLTGVVTFKNARKAVEVAEWIPLDRLLIETDCPFMAPEPNRGRRCDSTMVPLTAAKVAELRGLPVEAVAKATRENAMRLFSVPAP